MSHRYPPGRAGCDVDVVDPNRHLGYDAKTWGGFQEPLVHRVGQHAEEAVGVGDFRHEEVCGHGAVFVPHSHLGAPPEPVDPFPGE